MPCLCSRSAWQSRFPRWTITHTGILRDSIKPTSALKFLPRPRPLHDFASTSLPERTSHAKLKRQPEIYSGEKAPAVRIQGLVRSIRKQKRVAFAHVSDGSTYEPVQAILSPEKAQSIQHGAYVDLTGQWKDSPAKGQTKELHVDDVLYVGESNAEDNPIQPKAMTTEFLRSIPHLRMRTSAQSLILRTRSHFIRSVSDYFEKDTEMPAVQVHPPLITSSDCEGAGEVFTVALQNATQACPVGEEKTAELDPFFGEPKYLTVSSQLHLEAFCAELGDVWALSPTFRAEQSDTTRHLAEFYMLEAEFRGAYHLDSVINQAEDLIRHLAVHLSRSLLGAQHLDQYTHLTSNLKGSSEKDVPANPVERWEKLTSSSWPRITYSDAIAALKKAQASGHTFTLAPSWDTGLSLEHERYLVSHVYKNKQPVIVTHYPAEQKPFYMSITPRSIPSKSDGANTRETAECFDILLPDGYAEVCGGSLRENRLDRLLARMRKSGMLKPDTSSHASTATSNTPTGPSPSPLPSLSAFQPEKNHQQQQQLYPGLQPGESLGALKWYADLRRFGSSPHGGFGIGFDRLLAYLCGVGNVRDVVAFPRAWGRGDC